MEAVELDPVRDVLVLEIKKREKENRRRPQKQKQKKNVSTVLITYMGKHAGTEAWVDPHDRGAAHHAGGFGGLQLNAPV